MIVMFVIEVMILMFFGGCSRGNRMTQELLLGVKGKSCELHRKRLPYIWVFPKIGVPQNGWFIMENPIKMDDLGVSLLLETPICKYQLVQDCVKSTLYVMWSKIASTNLFRSLSWCTCACEFDRCTQIYPVLLIEFGKHTGEICLSLNLLKNDYTVAVCTLTRMIFDIGSMQYAWLLIYKKSTQMATHINNR